MKQDKTPWTMSVPAAGRNITASGATLLTEPRVPVRRRSLAKSRQWMLAG